MNKQPIRNNLIIELHIPDFDVAKKFYSILGFKVILEHVPTADKPGYLVMKLTTEMGETLLHFYGGNDLVYNQSYFKNYPKDTKRGYATSITIPVPSADEFYNKVADTLKDHIIQPVMDKEDKEMKWRDFRMEDPFGFYLRFTELIDWGQ
ncbi:hypothetical protein DRH29_01695 [candidate division Kazan bacterium]|uniref:VOC domain-containing protein n=1 Tax=candidate division Kazan bacterium TaxID=2202143 RepID=A0A420ZD16_UNCK3|nr:MAG: hypothetical protein DRH29_01695 [candidate division Kazan bacterium]